ncbi:Regulator of microtubule dynamics protein 1 [Halotydeus destructor]|nr:Regulator of microtubule dynamics protein 1 [Halotydeus destructor]
MSDSADKDKEKLIKEYESLDKTAMNKDTDQLATMKQLTEQLANYKGSNIARAEILWRLSRACLMQAMKYELVNGDKDKIKQLVYESRDRARASLEVNPNSPDAEQWTAIALGRILTNYTHNGKERVDIALEVKRRVDHALTIRPHDPILLYINGRWLFEVADLSWMEKKMAAVFAGKLPDVSYDQAIGQLQAVHDGGHRAKAVYYFLAKCWAAKKSYQEAVKWLDIGLTAGGMSWLEDEMYQPLLVALKEKYSKKIK